MFPVTINFTVNNAFELDAYTKALNDVFDGTRPRKPTAAEVKEHRDQNGGTMAEAKAAATKAKAAEPKKPTPEPEQPSSPSTGTTSESEPLDAQSDSGELAGDEKAYVLADAQDLTKKVVAAGKRNEMVALLAKYEAKVAAQLKTEQIAPFCVEAEGLLK